MDSDNSTIAAVGEPSAPTRPNALRVLANRDYALYWVGLLISATGSWMQNVAQGWLVFDLTGSKLYLGIVGAAGTLPMLFLALPGGVIADRFNKRRITILTQSLAMFQAFVLGLLTVKGLIKPWHVVLLAGFMGLVNSLDVPARQAMTVEIVGKSDLLSAVALNSSAFNGARILGPAIAGVIVGISGAGMCFLINAASYLAVIISLIIIRPTPLGATSSDASMMLQIREGLAYARRNPVIRDLLLLTGVASIFGLQYGTLIPALAKEVLRVGPERFGILVSSAGIGSVAAAVSIAAIGHLLMPRKVVSIGSILAPLGIIALSLTRQYFIAAACLVVIGFGMMLFLAVSNSIVQVASPDELRGRILSLRTLVFMGVAPIGSLQIGWFAQHFGVRASLAVGGILCLISALYFALKPESTNISPETFSASTAT
ncbi:MAG: MFS transporter [Armatimonadota bacterium]|nr:MFS transporter [Armatimonadota bacterium]